MTGIPVERQRLDFLAGLSVLELGDGVAGASAASILSRLGASVTTVTDKASVHRFGRPALGTLDGAAGTSLLATTLDAGKQIVGWPHGEATAADLDRVIREWRATDPSTLAHLVICDRVTRAPYGLSDLQNSREYSAWADLMSPGAWVSISAFGLSGPRRDDYGTDLTVSAVSGILGSISDCSGAPLKLPGSQALLSTGQAAALAACYCLDQAAEGHAAHVDVSAQEAAIATGPLLAVAMELLQGGQPAGAARYGSPSGNFETNDGLIRIMAMEEHQWDAIVRAMGSPAWAADYNTVESRITGSDAVDAHITEWTRTTTKADAEALLQAEGAAAAAMYTPRELIDSPQLSYRGAIETITAPDGTKVKVVGQPYAPVKARGDAPSSRRRLKGLRVLEAGQVLAIPLAGSLLGALGADVTKLEDFSRLDTYRRRGPFIAGEAGINQAVYFAMANFSKRSRAFDLTAHPERAAELLAQADVVIENYGAKRANTLGLSVYRVVEAGLPVLACSSSGYGYQGPQSRYRAYAYNIHTCAGLAYLTRARDGTRAEVDIAWADLIAGYAVATIVAAWAVGPRGNQPEGVDFSMAELVTSRLNEFVAAASLDPMSDDQVDRGNDAAPLAPNGVYRTADGWIALSVLSNAGFAALKDELGHPAALEDQRFATMRGRFDSRSDLDGAMAAAVATAGAGELSQRLRLAGISADAVLAPNQLPYDAHLQARGFFCVVDHPVWGRRPLTGIAWRLADSPAITISAPPLLPPRGEM